MTGICRSCAGWRTWNVADWGTCTTLAVPSPYPIDGEPAVSMPVKLGSDGCDRFAMRPDPVSERRARLAAKAQEAE